jgi:capsular polysaccharide biosynthesis protein
VELRDAVRRIIGLRWKLIATYVALGAFAGWGLHAGNASTYTSSTRLVLDTSDPKTQPEAAAIGDIAQAIATSPAQVKAALAAAHVEGRDAADIARQHVVVSALGSSGIVELSVSDPDRRAAAAIANALAQRVITTRLEVTRGHATAVQRDVDSQIARLSRRIADANAKIGALSAPTARGQAQRDRDFLVEQRSVLESQRASLASTGALDSQPAVISAASVPQKADSSGTLADIILGAILGLILGVGLVGLIETLRPTLVDGEAVGDELGVPVLGSLSRPPDEALDLDEIARVAARLRLAARSVGARHIGLVSPRTGLDLRLLAHQLEASLVASVSHFEAMPPVLEHITSAGELVHGPAGSESGAAGHVAAGPPTLRIRAYDPQNPAMANGTVIALVVVSPSPIAKAALADTGQLLRVSGTPLLGVVSFST